MDNKQIGKRAQDVQSGLRDVQDTLVSATIPITRQIGMAALLAVHIRGLEVIENIVGFHGFCTSLGISSDSLPMALGTLEATGWLRVTPNAFNPRRIEESIPYFQKVYDALGDQWTDRSPSDLELATMTLLDSLSAGPALEKTATSSLSIRPQDLQTVLEIGELGGYLRRYTSPREKVPILYAPQFVDENPESLLNLIARKGDDHEEVNRVIRITQAVPGAPVSDLQRALPLVAELVNSNVLSAAAIDSSTGTHSFAFAPYRTNKPRPILEKARIILACVRYGEHFSSITQIRSPMLILENLRDRRMIGRTPHTNIGSQYAAAANMGVGFIEEESGRFRFRLYDTDDNLSAVDLAISMCSGAAEDDVHTLMPPDEVRERISSSGRVGSLVLPQSNRGRARSRLLSRSLDPRTQTAQRLGRDLLDDLRGIHRVLK